MMKNAKFVSQNFMFLCAESFGGMKDTYVIWQNFAERCSPHLLFGSRWNRLKFFIFEFLTHCSEQRFFININFFDAADTIKAPTENARRTPADTWIFHATYLFSSHGNMTKHRVQWSGFDRYKYWRESAPLIKAIVAVLRVQTCDQVWMKTFKQST